MKNNKRIREKQSVVEPPGLGRWRQEENAQGLFQLYCEFKASLIYVDQKQIKERGRLQWQIKKRWEEKEDGSSQIPRSPQQRAQGIG